MLVLTRKHQEKIRIGDNITITILKTKGKAVRVGIEAPADIAVVRGELTSNGFGAAEPEAAAVAEALPANRSTRPRAVRLESAWTTESRPVSTPASRRHQPMDVTLQRVPRKSISQVLPRLVGEGGPLRSMVEQRATV